MTRFTVLYIGQSNMAGYRGPALPPPAHSRAVSAWDWAAALWKPAKLGTKPFHNAAPGVPAHNLAFACAHQIALQGDMDSDIVLFASNGKRVEYLLPNVTLATHGWSNTQSGDPEFGASLAEEIFGASGSAKQALAALGKSRFDAVCVHQGEAQAGDTAPVMAAKYEALVAELQTRGLICPTTPIVFGEINPRYGHAAIHTESLGRLAAQDRRVRVVRWDGIEDVCAITGADDKHATGHGLAKLGRDYAAAVLAEAMELAIA